MVAAVFMDRDGTLNEDTGFVSKPEDLVIYPWAAEAVRLINRAGMKAIVVTNQSGVARGFYSEETLGLIHERLICELGRAGARLDGIYYCPHHPDSADERYRISCDCRKPLPGMLRRAAREHGVDLGSSFVVGDKPSDLELARNAGARSALVLTGRGRQTAASLIAAGCKPDLIAADLLEAVRLILDRIGPQGIR